jgi:hypothetical protein
MQHDEQFMARQTREVREAFLEPTVQPTLLIGGRLYAHLQLNFVPPRASYASIFKNLHDDTRVFATRSGRDCLIRLVREMREATFPATDYTRNLQSVECANFLDALERVARESFALDEQGVTADFNDVN